MQKPRILLTFHRWIALAFAPLLLVQAVTGGMLLFRDELTSLSIPAQTSREGERASLSVIVDAAGQAFPGMRLTRLFYPVDDRSAAFAQLERSGGVVRYAAIDPGSGAVLSQGTILQYPLEAALQIHFRLLSGSVGMTIVALNGLALALLAASGLWQWWPGASRVPQALKIPARTPARLRLRMWHRSVGAVLAFVLLTSSATGIFLSVPNISFPGSPNAPIEPTPIDGASLDAAFAAAQAAYPGAQPRDVRFAPDGSLSVNFFAPRGGHWAVDVATVSSGGQPVATALPLEQNDALWLTMLPIHTGDSIGPVGRWPMLAAAFALLFLACSGPLAWWRSTRKGKRK